MPYRAPDRVPGGGRAAGEVRTAGEAVQESELSFPPDQLLTRVTDTSVSLERRAEWIVRQIEGGDPAGIESVMRVGDAGVYAAYTAVRALGGVRSDSALSDKVESYLRTRLAHDDAQLAVAAIEAYAERGAADTVKGLLHALRANRARADGYEAIVCESVVNGLAARPDPTAVEPLIGELERVGKGVWGLNYGSAVVRALGRIGTEQARAALNGYADRLEAGMPEDPLARRSYVESATEARQLARDKAEPAPDAAP